jgi:hypothetical protein
MEPVCDVGICRKACKGNHEHHGTVYRPWIGKTIDCFVQDPDTHDNQEKPVTKRSNDLGSVKAICPFLCWQGTGSPDCRK